MTDTPTQPPAEENYDKSPAGQAAHIAWKYANELCADGKRLFALEDAIARAIRLGQVEAWIEAELIGEEVNLDGQNVPLGEEWSWDDTILEYQARIRERAEQIEKEIR